LDAIRKWQVRSVFAIPILISTINVAKGNMIEATMSFTLSFFVITCTCIGYMVFFTLVENKSYSDRLVCVMTPMIPLVFLFMQPANNMLPLGVGILFSATIGYINSTELLISMDWLTNTNNRYYLYTFIDHRLKHLTNDLHILMIDADDFKKINDTFGHQEGDRCLIRIADAIKIACNKLPRRAYICRYGGDEFIVVAECSDSELFELKANINAELEELNEVSICKTYISIGSYTQRMNGSSISGLDFVKFADKALYEVKKAKK
jgi:diguanylate cyclase (GGDEF)-like protein